MIIQQEGQRERERGDVRRSGAEVTHRGSRCGPTRLHHFVSAGVPRCKREKERGRGEREREGEKRQTLSRVHDARGCGLRTTGETSGYTRAAPPTTLDDDVIPPAATWNPSDAAAATTTRHGHDTTYDGSAAFQPLHQPVPPNLKTTITRNQEQSQPRRTRHERSGGNAVTYETELTRRPSRLEPSSPIPLAAPRRALLLAALPVHHRLALTEYERGLFFQAALFVFSRDFSYHPSP